MSVSNTFLGSFQQVLPCWEVSIRKAVKNILQIAPTLLQLSPLGSHLLSILFIVGIGQIPVDLSTSMWVFVPSGTCSMAKHSLTAMVKLLLLQSLSHKNAVHLLFLCHFRKSVTGPLTMT